MGCAGQSTVEFAVVVSALMVISVGVAALWRMLGEGLVVDHALQSASHHVQVATGFALADVFSF